MGKITDKEWAATRCDLDTHYWGKWSKPETRIERNRNGDAIISRPSQTRTCKRCGYVDTRYLR